MKPEGVTLYEVVGKTLDEFGNVKSLTIDESKDATVIKGKAYFFKATKEATFVPSDYDYLKTALAETDQMLYGVLDPTQVPGGVYMLKDNTLYKAAEGSRCAANRAYLVMSEVPEMDAASQANLSRKAISFQFDDDATVTEE